jgi:hypothetical protein
MNLIPNIFIGTLNQRLYIKFVGLGLASTNIRGARVDLDRPHIFVGAATSPMNVIHIYSSETWPHRRIYGGRADGIRPAYIHQLINEYMRARFPTGTSHSFSLMHSCPLSPTPLPPVALTATAVTCTHRCRPYTADQPDLEGCLSNFFKKIR